MSPLLLPYDKHRVDRQSLNASFRLLEKPSRERKRAVKSEAMNREKHLLIE